MSKTEKTEDAQTPLSNEVAQAIVNIAKLQQDQADSAKIPQIPLSKAKIVTPFNPTGDKKRPNLSRPTYMNDARLHEKYLHTEEIVLFNQVQSGKFHGNTWIVTENDAPGEMTSIHLYVPNKTPEQRLDTARTAGTDGLRGILRMIVDEQTARAAA